ncbi:hypothetical protein [Stenotrophomonas maltophilia]|uniref:hypothetical protein n=1 Tax=Stenotrophomonas maltophilia TaxID=40324 RepID=UPI0015DE179A|nr:hypothetical protein [Stenotrophomonas maltophilia]MBA0286844.1 hypothetical protein [Stenotrophomonas maltophilia]MBA0322659.1 hypothetical protein [Stenotrophomonas maltophilia]
MKKLIWIAALVAAPIAAHSAEPDPLSCAALTAGKSKSDEEKIETFARIIPNGAAKHLTDVYRKELLRKGANEYSAFSASLDYYAKIALPLAEEVTAQFALIAKQEGSYVKGVRRYCKDKKMNISEFFNRAFDAALVDKVKDLPDDND